MTQDEVKIISQGATPWKTNIFLRRRVELFTGWWVSCCWVPKRDGAENEKNNYKIHEGNRKGKHKHFVWCNLKYMKKIIIFFHSLIKSFKESCKLLIMSRVPCSNEFSIKRLISRKINKWKERKKERGKVRREKESKRERKKGRKVLFPLLVRLTF